MDARLENAGGGTASPIDKSGDCLKESAETPMGSLSIGDTAIISGFNRCSPELEIKLRQIGFAENDEIEIMAVGPVGKSPVSVRIGATLVAVRRGEADAIDVRRQDSE
ncbi:MAG: FeoA family protein [Pseudomonadota bacterium]